MQLELELRPPRDPALLIADSAEAAWQAVIADWFARVGAQCWRSQRPSAVVVPTHGHAQALKARLLAAGRSTLGIEFVTPRWIRLQLARATATPPAPREQLHMLLALAAEEEIADASLSDAERLAAISVRRTPDHLLRLLDQLSAAGVPFEKIDLPAFRPVVRKFRQHLAATGLAINSDVDRQVLADVGTRAPIMSHLLVTGFHGAHWPLWHLLGAAVRSAENATVVLQYPRAEAIDLDTAWIGSWEEAFGEARPVEAIEKPHPANRETIFLAGLDTREQADAIVAVAHSFLAEKHCARLGILFPAAGALSRLVASALSRHGISHYDAMGQMVPGIFETPVFRAWTELQRTPRLNALNRFLTALPHDHSLFEKISRRAIADALQQSLGQLAIDDLAMLITHARGHHDKGELISQTLARIHFVPARGIFAEFVSATQRAFAELGWGERWTEIEARTTSLAVMPEIFSRTLFLRWLEEIAVSFRVTRDASSAHPYARVHLLTPAQAEDQSWSHLIFTGLNESIWPAAPAGDFLPATQIDAVNQGVQKLNRTATRRGRQGEGHITVQEGRALFLGAAQQRQLAQAQFAGLLDSASHGVAFTASVIQEETPERISNPSEFLNRAYHAAHGRALSQQDLRALRDATHRWLQTAPLESPNEFSRTPDVLQTRVAYDARRNAGPSDEYDFTLRTAPAEIAPLSVSQVEELLKAPAQVWMARYLGVEGEEDTSYAWNATAGKWTHDWLAQIGDGRDGFVAFPSAGEIEERILAAARRKRAEVTQLCRQAGRQLPDWWESGWDGAVCLAQTLGRVLSRAEGWKWIVPEWQLETQPIDVGDGRALLLRGRTDLLLANTAALPASLAVPELWIVDFKSGNKESLAKGLGKPETWPEKVRRKVLKGDALQLSLYALAARQHGAENVRVSLLSPIISSAEPQLNLENFSECQAAFRELARMQATGFFGFRGPLRSAYTFTKAYPLATLAIDPEIVDERWEATHPDLVVEEESWR